jgi:hypothetical protein
VIDHYTDMHTAAEIRQMRANTLRMVRAIAIAGAASLVTIAILHDAPARVAATVMQAEQEQGQ